MIIYSDTDTLLGHIQHISCPELSSLSVSEKAVFMNYCGMPRLWNYSISFLMFEHYVVIGYLTNNTYVSEESRHWPARIHRFLRSFNTTLFFFICCIVLQASLPFFSLAQCWLLKWANLKNTSAPSRFHERFYFIHFLSLSLTPFVLHHYSYRHVVLALICQQKKLYTDSADLFVSSAKRARSSSPSKLQKSANKYKSNR